MCGYLAEGTQARRIAKSPTPIMAAPAGLSPEDPLEAGIDVQSPLDQDRHLIIELTLHINLKDISINHNTYDK